MLLLSWILAATVAADLPLASLSIHPDPAERTRIVRGLLAVWLSAGHELGTHGHAHLDYAATNLAVYLADLEARG